MAEHTPRHFRLNLVNAAEDVPRLVRAYGRACDGEFALVLRPREQRGVLVLVTKKDGARMWRSGEGEADAPGMPDAAIAPADAVKLVKVEQKALPTVGPITLRGQWSGQLICDGGQPRVELRRVMVARSATWAATRGRRPRRAGGRPGPARPAARGLAGGAAAHGAGAEADPLRHAARRVADVQGEGEAGGRGGDRAGG